jgi:hypothetical protein
MIQGPNVRKLIAHKMSLLMVPKGAGLAGALKSMVTPGAIGNFAREATQWVETALAAVKAAPGNPYGDDDEAIAVEILGRLSTLRAGQTNEGRP